MAGIQVLEETSRYVVEWGHDEPSVEGPEPVTAAELLEMVRIRLGLTDAAEGAQPIRTESESEEMVGVPLF